MTSESTPGDLTMTTRKAVGPVGRHKFSPDILREVNGCLKLDNWHGPRELVEHWFVIATVVWSSVWAWKHLEAVVAVPTYLVAVFLIGGRQRALAGVLHQACHRTFMRNRLVEQKLATLLAGYAVLQSFSGYRSSHVHKHHGRFGDPDLDPDYLHYQASGLCGVDLSPAVLSQHLIRLFGVRATLSYTGYIVRNRIWNAAEDTGERCVRIAGILLVVIGAAVSGLLPLAVAYWMVPLVTAQAWIGSLTELCEHYPLIESAPRIDIYMSRNRQYSQIVAALLGEQPGERYHLVHHLFPRVPLWRAEQVHKILMRDPVYAGLHKHTGILGSFRSMFEALQCPIGPNKQEANDTMSYFRIADSAGACHPEASTFSPLDVSPPVIFRLASDVARANLNSSDIDSEKIARIYNF